MNYQELRNRSIAKVKKLGYEVNPSLPLLDSAVEVRDGKDVVARLLCLYAVVAASYGMARNLTRQWLEKEGLFQSLTPFEENYLNANPSSKADNLIQWSVESVWAFAWACGYHDNLDFSDSCADDFIQMLPDLNSQESVDTFSAQAEIRSKPEIEEALDLAYCIHWSVREAQRENRKPPGNVPPNVIEQRRKALEWLLGDVEWDDVTLDT